MADGQELDNLLIRVDSELGSLSGIQTAIDALDRLAKFNQDATQGIRQFNSLVTTFKKLDGIKLDGLEQASRGVRILVGALDDLSKVGAVTKKQFNDFGKLGKVLKDSFDGVGTALKGIEEVSWGVNNMVKALASLGQVQGVTKQAVSNLGSLGDAVHHFNGLDKDIEKIIDPMERLMKAIGNLGNNNRVSIRVDSNGVANVRNITRHTQKAMSTWSEFERQLSDDISNIDLGQLFDISQPVDRMQANLKVAERQLQTFENQVRTNAQRVNRDLSSFSFADMANDRGFRNAFHAGSMAEALAEQYRQGIPQLRTAIENANIQAINDAWAHTQQAIRQDSRIDLSRLVNTNLPIEDIRRNFRTLENELSRAQSSMQRAYTELRRLRSLESNEQTLRSQGSYRNAVYTYAVQTRHVEQYRRALEHLHRTMRVAEREQQSDVPLLRQLPQLQQQLERYQEMYNQLLDNQNRTPEQDRQLGVFQSGIEAIRDRIQQIHDTLEDIPETTEGVMERMRQMADEADRMARATTETQRNLQESVGNGFSQFGNMLSGSGNQLLGSFGRLSTMFGNEARRGIIPPEMLERVGSLAGTLGRVATVMSHVSAVAGVVVALFKTWWSVMNKVKDALSQFVQSAIQFAKNMLNNVVGAFNAVSGAVGKVVSSVRSGAQAITVALRQIKDVGSKIISVFSSFGGTALTSIVKAGKAIANLVTPKVVKNLASASGSLKDIVKQSKLLSTALQTVNKWFTMLTRMLMRKIVQQFISGLKQAFDDLVLFEKNSNDAMLKFNYHVSEIFSALRRAANQWIAAFEPLINAVTPVVLNFLANVQSVGEAVAIFMAKLTGQGYYIRAKKFYEDYGESIDKTTKKAKNLTNALDELNILNNSSSKNDSDLPVEDLFEKVPVNGGLNFPDIQVAIQDILDKIKDWLKSIDWDWLKEKAREWVKKIFDVINTILRDKEFWQLLGKTVAELVNFLFTIVNEAVHDLDWKALGQAIAEFIKNALENLDWALIRDTVVTLAKGLATTWNEIFADKQLWKDIGSTVAHVINDVIVAYLDSFAWTFDFKNMADSVSLAIKTALEGIDWQQIRHAVDGWTKGITDAVNEWATDKQLWTDIGNTIKHTINDIFINAFNDLGNIDFKSLTENLKASIARALDINWDEFNEGVQKWAQNIVDVINGFLADKEFLTTITTSIANFANAIIDGFDAILKKLQSYDIGNAIGNAIVKGLSSIHWDTLFTIPADAINALSNAIRGLLDAIPDDFNLGTWIADHLSLTIETVDWDLIKKNINDFADQLVNTINGLVGNDRLWNNLEQVTTVTLDVVVNLIGKIREINWSDLAERIKNYVNNVIKGGYVRQILADLGNIAIDLVFAVDLFIRGVDWSELGRQIAEGLNTAIDRLYANRGALQQMIENAFKAFSDLVSETLRGLLKNNSFYKLGTVIGNLILGIINGLAIFFDENTTNIVESMKQFANGLADFIYAHQQEIINSLNRIIDAIVKILDSFFDEKGKLWTAINDVLKGLNLGELLGSLIRNFLLKTLTKLKTTLAIGEALDKNLDSLAKEVAGALKKWGKFFLDRLKYYLFDWESPQAMLGQWLADKIKGLFGLDKGINISSIFDKISFTGIADALKTLKDKLKTALLGKDGKLFEFTGGGLLGWLTGGKEKAEVPVDIKPTISDDEKMSMEDFVEQKPVELQFEDASLGKIKANTIEVEIFKGKKLNIEEINAEVLNVVEIFADKLHVGEIDDDAKTKKKDLDPNYGANDVGVQTGSVNNPNGDLHVKNIYAELLDVKKILSELLEVTEIKTELLDAEKILTRLIDAKKITTKWLDAKKITTKLLDAQKITTKLLEASQILTELLEAQKVHTWLFEVEKIDVKEGADGIGVSLQDAGGTLNLEGINAGWLNVPTITADLLRVGTIEGNIRGTSGYTPTGIIGASTGTSNYDNMFGVPSIERPRIEVGDRWSDLSGLAPHAEDFLTGVEDYWANLTDTWGKTVSVTPAVNLAGNNGGYGVTHTLPRNESGSNGNVIPLSDFDKNMSGVVAGAKVKNLPSNADYIRDYLMSFIGNENGVYGLMGNLYAESGLKSNNLQDIKKGEGVTQRDLDYTKNANNSSSSFINDNKGYGLAQWTTSDRKKAFYDSLNGRSVDDLGAQLEYLKSELMSSQYKNVLDKLRNASSIEEASNAVLYDFEKPNDKSASVAELRMAYGQDIAGQLGSYDGTVNIEDEETPTTDGIKGFDEANIIGETGGNGGIFSFLDTLPLQTEYRMAEVYNIIDKWLGRIYKLFKSFTVDGFLEDLLKLNEIGDIFDSAILKELRDLLKEIVSLLRKLIEDGIKSVEDTRHLDLNTDAKSQNTKAVESLTDAIYDWIKCAGDTGHLDNNTVAKSKNTQAVERLNQIIGGLGTQLANVKCECNCCGNCGGCGGGSSQSTTRHTNIDNYTPDTQYGNTNTISNPSGGTGGGSTTPSRPTGTTGGGSVSTGVTGGGKIVLRRGGKSIPMFINIGGKLVPLTDSSPDYVKQLALSGKYVFVDSTGKSISSSDQKALLAYIKKKWGSASTNRSNTSNTGLNSTTHTLNNPANLDHNTQTADTGTIKNPSGTKTSGGNNLPATTKTNSTGGKSSNTSSGGSSTGGKSSNTSSGGSSTGGKSSNTSSGGSNTGGKSSNTSSGGSNTGGKSSNTSSGGSNIGGGSHSNGDSNDSFHDESNNGGSYDENNNNESSEKPEREPYHREAINPASKDNKNYDRWVSEVEEARNGADALLNTINSSDNESLKKSAQQTYDWLMANNNQVTSDNYKDARKQLELYAMQAKGLSNSDSLDSEAKNMLDKILNSKYATQAIKDKAQNEYYNFKTYLDRQDRNGISAFYDALKQDYDKLQESGATELQKNARIGINGGVWNINELGATEDGKKALATALISNRDHNGKEINWYSQGNGSTNSASAKDKITDAETINEIKQYIKSHFGINESSPNDLYDTQSKAYEAYKKAIASGDAETIEKAKDYLDSYLAWYGYGGDKNTRKSRMDSYYDKLRELSGVDVKGEKEAEQQKANNEKVQKAINSINNDERFQFGTQSNWLYSSTKEYPVTATNPFFKQHISEIEAQINGQGKQYVKANAGGNVLQVGVDGITLPDVTSTISAWYERFKAKGYQMGGIPNAGEIFVARENGTPEFVGSFGGKTAVANNDQIVTAVANGVAMANDSLRSAIESQTNALENAIDRKNLDVNIGDRQIAEANRRGEKDLGQNFMN